MKHIYLLKIIGLLIFTLILNSCKSSNPCPAEPAKGNVGYMLNTKLNDYLPLAVNDSLYYISTRSESPHQEKLYVSKFANNEFSTPQPDTSLPMKNFIKTGTPAIFYSQGKIQEVYFSGIPKNVKRNNPKIYYSKRSEKGWDIPKPIDTTISNDYVSQPAISPDGKALVFISDKQGGTGKTDLYMITRQANGSWSSPVNLGSAINTPFEESSPYIAPDGSLYYSSKGFGNKKSYDIIKADKTGDKWKNARALLYPINTDFDESGVTIIGNKLLFSSNRLNGCGGFDLYMFDLCGNVTLDGKITNDKLPIKLNGSLEVNSNDGKKIDEITIPESGLFKLNLQADKNYILRYKNQCYSNMIIEQDIYAPCNDSDVVRLLLNLKIPDDLKYFNFEKDVPFFVTGYYLPNTTGNLEALRMKFSYGLIGNSDSTKYIENPGKEYDAYAVEVDKIIDNAVEFIINNINSIDWSCFNSNAKLYIYVHGFSDPRPISDLARYEGVDIDDELLNFSISKGEEMNNELLSKLRAYFTARHLLNILEKIDEYNTNIGRIKWVIEGKGIDEGTVSNPLKRRTNIEMRISDK